MSSTCPTETPVSEDSTPAPLDPPDVDETQSSAEAWTTLRRVEESPIGDRPLLGVVYPTEPPDEPAPAPLDWRWVLGGAVAGGAVAVLHLIELVSIAFLFWRS